jgi:RNA polymerase sigma factor (sigma-70 family)
MTTEQRNQLVINYIPLANKIACQKNKITPKSITLDELKSAAYLGLLDAANKYKKIKNCSFATYAKFRIIGEIKDFLRKNKKNHLELNEEFSYEDDQYYNNLDLFSYVFSFLDCTGQKIIRMYYIENKSMKEIGKNLNLNESRISQLISKYKKIIRKKI